MNSQEKIPYSVGGFEQKSSDAASEAESEWGKEISAKDPETLLAKVLTEFNGDPFQIPSEDYKIYLEAAERYQNEVQQGKRDPSIRRFNIIAADIIKKAPEET